MGTFLTMKHAAPRMAAAGGGSYVAISSHAGLDTFRFLGAYGAAKAGMDFFVRVAADELGPSRVRVNSVPPGDHRQRDHGGHHRAAARCSTATSRRRRCTGSGRVEDVSALVRFLVGPESAGSAASASASTVASRCAGAPTTRPSPQMAYGDDPRWQLVVEPPHPEARLMQVEGTVAVVTGGASGIGRADRARARPARGRRRRAADIHERCARGGARTRSRPSGAGADRALRRRRATRDVEQLRDEAMSRRWADVDILMNNAGVAVLGPPETMLAMEEWDWILQINLYGVIRGVRAFLPHLLERGSGYIVNTASVAGLFAYAWDTIPRTSPRSTASSGFTEALELYVEPLGVGVSVLCPGLVGTNMGETARLCGLDDPAAWIQEMPLTRPGRARASSGRAVADAIRDDRFLMLTHPEEARERMGRRGNDLDAFVAAQIDRLPTPPEPRVISRRLNALSGLGA